jgi:hypothetical protein
MYRYDVFMVSAPLSTHTGNTIVVNSFTVTSPTGTTINIPVASGNSATTTAFTGQSLSGTWYVYATCTCYSGTTVGYSSSVYYPVSITATY